MHADLTWTYTYSVEHVRVDSVDTKGTGRVVATMGPHVALVALDTVTKGGPQVKPGHRLAFGRSCLSTIEGG